MGKGELDGRHLGLGAPLVAMVGTSIGAGNRERALRVALIGAGIATALTEAISLGAAVFSHAGLSFFDTDPAMLDAGERYLRVVGDGERRRSAHKSPQARATA